MNELTESPDTPAKRARRKRRRKTIGLHDARRSTEYQALVVDEDVTIRDAVAKILESLGYRVSKAEEGLTAISHLAVAHYDVVITDFDLPMMNGYRLTVWIKQESPQTRVVVMTAGCHAEVHQFMSTGIVDKWLFKPFDREALCEVFDKLQLPDGCSHLK